MPPKAAKKQSGKADKPKVGEERREDALQALVLTDSYETKFEPFTLERPRCLLPLANTPLLEYTLEFLAAADVEEVFLYCGNHTEQVEEYIASSKWTQSTAPFSVEVIRSQSHSIGDAMRDMEQKQRLVGDFICVYGDVISNINLKPALTEHKARREKDKKAIMTMVLREAGDSHRSKSNAARPVFVVDPGRQRCLHYEQLQAGQHARLNIDGEILSDHPELEIRADLIDCGIDICSQEVLAQYSDNFDWQMPRRGFLHGILKDFELFQLTVHTHIASEGYAARVRSLQAYDAISRDVISRWTYPLCPDSNILPDQTFQLSKSSVYKENGVTLARSAKITKKTVIGQGSSFGEDTVVSNSVIGRRCVIGSRVKLDGVYILDDVHIDDDSVIENACIGTGATIGKKCRLQSDVLIAYGVKIASDMEIARGRRISRFKRKRTSDGSLTEAITDSKIVGETGIGASLEADEDEDLIEGLVPAISPDQDDDAESISTVNSAYSDDESESSHQYRSSRTDSFGSIASDESGNERHRAADFHHEAASSIFDSIQKGDGADSIQLELKALTLSSNADGKQVRRAVAVALMKRVASLVEGGLTPQKAVAQTILPNRLLVERAVLDRDAKVKVEQVEFLLFMQTDLLHRVQGSKILLYACNALAQGELVDDEGLEQWLEDPRSSASDELSEIKKETEEIIGGEEDSENEEDSDDDDDE
ncbi:hypothetical protein AMS68_005278 [Peltaster fructicola]|uniref:Mannose-1-phosphate guanyltransferase n=1 Tax=Peltaster fructicola TaxID=286661 RepID=A0A6H0XYL8_9PEZI|nr:hypothetical protein AMS68_005278 [Peltaster fructicola]